MSSNLTRAEAAERSRLLSVKSYRVDLDLTRGDSIFCSDTTVRFSCGKPGAATFIDLTAPRVTEITLNGEQQSAGGFDGHRLALRGLAAENELRIVAECAYSRTGEGLHRFTDPADKNTYTYTDLETFDAHQVYACFDQPDLKATIEFVVTAEPGWEVISNMAPREIPERGMTQTAVTWHFPPTPVISTYYSAVAAGPYHAVHSIHDGIPLGLYCRQSLAQYLDPDEIFEVTRQGFDFYHQAFGVRYPFGKYDQLFVPEFKMGAMENAGCVTFVEQYIFRSRVTELAREARAETILHEMAHMWFGDLVTMRWWDDLWLNESFASWASLFAQAEATRWPNAWTTFAQAWKAWAYRQDQLPSTHPIAADIEDIEAVDVNFDGITYAKGAAVLKQLVAYVGLDNFLAGVRAYFAAHAWGNATLGDLLGALEQASGRDLASWSKAWLETAGVNTLRPEYQTDAGGIFTTFSILQEAPAAHPVLRPHRIAIGLYDKQDSGLVRRRRVETDIAGDRTNVPELAGEPLPDLVLVNDDDLSFVKIRLDPHSLRTLITSITEFTSSLPAALCWAAAWDMCRDAEMTATDYVDLALAGVGSITDIAVLQTVLRQAVSAARRFTNPARRPAAVGKLAGALRELMFTAEPGSDAQLTYVQLFASVATSATDLELLGRLRDGTVTIEGLAVDTELRWLLLRRLVSRGAAGPAEIDAELDTDRTDAGERHAAACRAAIPDPAAKTQAWDLITSGELPNAVFRATLDGFFAADQDELVAPYAQRYFDIVLSAVQDWGSDMGRYFAEYAYPAMIISAETIAATDEFLARTDPPAPLRRLIIEGRDDVARALRCQQADDAAAER